jgi:hypothetical protein
MKTTTISIFSLAAALLSLACSSAFAGSIRIGDTPAAKIAKDMHLPGKGVAGQCLPFANALHEKLQAAGIASRVIVYGYQAAGMPETGRGGIAGCAAHAVVEYDDNGRTYVMDNQSWTPKWVHAGAPVQIAQRFSGIACDVKVARVLPDALPVVASGPVGSPVRLASK